MSMLIAPVLSREKLERGDDVMVIDVRQAVDVEADPYIVHLALCASAPNR